MPHVIWFECLRILTQKNVQFVYLGGKVGGNVLKCLGILKYQKIAIPYSFCDIKANCDPFEFLFIKYT
jgi:hypothetical protein